jgi:exopolysaccharide biosynthesis predicted pyruvyltransferase EpsI
MKQNDYIALLDPSLQNNNGEPSDNLGDLIIHDSVKKLLEELFPGKEIIRISTHAFLAKKEKMIVNNSLYTFVGGTNILTSDIRHFPRLTPVKRKGFYLFPGFNKVILCGVGWATYDQQMDWATRFYYKSILRKNVLHSARDNYSVTKLKEAGFRNVLHTSCPTTWDINTSFSNKFNSSYGKVLLMLTNYNKNEITDNKLMETILHTDAHEIYFFPQSSLDSTYISTLPAFKNNRSKFKLLDHKLSEFYSLISSVKLNYIGNRLHGGIKCLASDQPAMIISLDNRAIEMCKSIHLNVAERDDFSLVKKWISNEYVPPPVTLPLENIKHWKTQFVMN